MNEDVKYIIEHPGRYAVSYGRLDMVYAMVESTADGTVYQLNPLGERDGVLSADGWDERTRAYHVYDDEKTFVRVTSSPQP